jgi:hypothetical protein
MDSNPSTSGLQKNTSSEVQKKISSGDKNPTVSAKEKSKSHRTKTSAKKTIDAITTMKNSIVQSYSIEEITINISEIDHLDDAKEPIIFLYNDSKRLEAKILKNACDSGKCLKKIKKLCHKENKKFDIFLSECGVTWSISHINFLIKLYNLSKIYKKIVYVSCSLYFMHKNFKQISNDIKNDKDFWTM